MTLGKTLHVFVPQFLIYEMGIMMPPSQGYWDKVAHMEGF